MKILWLKLLLALYEARLVAAREFARNLERTIENERRRAASEVAEAETEASRARIALVAARSEATRKELRCPDSHL